MKFSDVMKETKPPQQPEPPVEEAVKVPIKKPLDLADKLYIENVLLKEENDKLRAQLSAKSLRGEREKLHDHFVDKYDIDTENYVFTVDDTKTLNIIPIKK